MNLKECLNFHRVKEDDKVILMTSACDKARKPYLIPCLYYNYRNMLDEDKLEDIEVIAADIIYAIGERNLVFIVHNSVQDLLSLGCEWNGIERKM